MENIYIVPGITAVLFFIFNYIDEKYIKKNNTINTKLIFRNSLLVFICVIISILVFEQAIPVTQLITNKKNVVFVSKPEF